jgi:hypothetical protein
VQVRNKPHRLAPFLPESHTPRAILWEFRNVSGEMGGK